MQGTFKSETPFEKRRELCTRIKTQYKDRVPVIVEVANNVQLTLSRKKFLAPSDISVGGFLGEIRKQASIRPEQAIFLFCGKSSVLVPASYTLDHVYEVYKDEDGFLYMTVALENTFGTLGNLEYLLDEVLKGGGRVARTLGLGNWL